LIPWSAFWERNYFVAWSANAGLLLTNNYVRGAITGLGLVNLAAALVELADFLGTRSRQPAEDDRS
jgi:ABC-type transport system involved in cytochrome c biogenesis permease subunit